MRLQASGFRLLALIALAACGAKAKPAPAPLPTENKPPPPRSPATPSCADLVDLQLKIMLATPGITEDQKSELEGERDDAIQGCQANPPTPEVAQCLVKQSTMEGMQDCVKQLPAGLRAPTADDLATFTANIPGTGALTATIDTPMGSIHCTLYGDKAPITVANFVGLATGQLAWMDPRTQRVQTGKPFYDGLVFHRVVPGFMIQGGDPLGDGTGGPGYQFADEISTDLTFDKAGVLAMANSGPGGTNGSQFFITEGPQLDLNGGYTIFGQCGDPKVVHAIASVPATRQAEYADDPVVMTRVTISK